MLKTVDIFAWADTSEHGSCSTPSRAFSKVALCSWKNMSPSLWGRSFLETTETEDRQFIDANMNKTVIFSGWADTFTFQNETKHTFSPQKITLVSWKNLSPSVEYGGPDPPATLQRRSFSKSIDIAKSEISLIGPIVAVRSRQKCSEGVIGMSRTRFQGVL